MSSDTDVVYFYDGMVNAPAVSGTAGTGKDALYAFLVTGFNTKTITSLTRSGTTATAVCSAHGFENNRVINLAGVNEAGWNERYRLTSVQTNSFTFTVLDTLTTPATGTIQAKYAPAQWTRLDDGSNISAFQQGVTGGHYIRVDDSNAKYLRFMGYRTMTDRNNGSDPYPSSGGYYLAKSNAADANARGYFFMADQEEFCWGIEYYPSNYSGQRAFLAYGSLLSFLAGDAFHRFLLGATADESSSSPGGSSIYPFINTYSDNNAPGQILAKSFDQQTGPVYFRKLGFGLQTTLGSGGLPYPSLADLGGRATRIVIVESANGQDRGLLPGIFQPPQDLVTAAVAHGTVWTDLAGYEGREIMVVRTYGNSRMLIDRTGPWR